MTVLDDRKVEKTSEEMSSLTITKNGITQRHEFDYEDPAQVKENRDRFDAVMSAGGSLGYATPKGGKAETIHRGEFPVGQAQVTVQPQYAGG